MDQQSRRPWLVTLTAFAVFILAAGHFVQGAQAAARLPELERLPLSVSPWYFVLGGAVWGLGWLMGGIGLWRMKEGARRFLLAWIPLSLAAWLADRLWLSRSPDNWQSIGFDLGLRLAAGIALALLLLGLASRFSARKT
jgi:hypothetical protein